VDRNLTEFLQEYSRVNVPEFRDSVMCGRAKKPANLAVRVRGQNDASVQ